MSDPFSSREDLEFDPDFFDITQDLTNEQYITVTHKMMAWDIGHSFSHWARVDTEGEEISDDGRDEMAAMVLHLESITMGAQSLIERLIHKLSMEQRADIVCRKLENVHGIPFKAVPFYDDQGKVIGHGFQPVEGEIDMEELKTWLDQAGHQGE